MTIAADRTLVDEDQYDGDCDDDYDDDGGGDDNDDDDDYDDDGGGDDDDEDGVDMYVDDVGGDGAAHADHDAGISCPCKCFCYLENDICNISLGFFSVKQPFI